MARGVDGHGEVQRRHGQAPGARPPGHGGGSRHHGTYRPTLHLHLHLEHCQPLQACGEHGVEVVAGRHVPAVEARPLLALDWGEEEVREVVAPKAPPLRSYFGEVGGRNRPFPSTDLRRRRAAPPPVQVCRAVLGCCGMPDTNLRRQEWEEWGGYSAGTISEFLGANRWARASARGTRSGWSTR